MTLKETISDFLLGNFGNIYLPAWIRDKASELAELIEKQQVAVAGPSATRHD
jgi:hypothetical protein